MSSCESLASRTASSGRVADFVAAGAEFETADIVVLNRVVCCYPDMPGLVATAADHSQAMLLMTFPKRRRWTRLLVSALNLGLGLSRREFHVFVHRPEDRGSRRGPGACGRC